MKLIIRFLKNYFFGIIVGILFLNSMNTLLASTIQSSDVLYVTGKNVKQAIDELYTNTNAVNYFVSGNSINVDGYGQYGGQIGFNYWNDSFSNRAYQNRLPSVYYSSLADLISGYGEDNFNNNPYYVKYNGYAGGGVACVFYNNKEYCISTTPMTLSELRNDIEKKMGVTPTCTSYTYVTKCSFGGHSCGYSSTSGATQAICGKCNSTSCGSNVGL